MDTTFYVFPRRGQNFETFPDVHVGSHVHLHVHVHVKVICLYVLALKSYLNLLLSPDSVRMRHVREMFANYL